MDEMRYDSGFGRACRSGCAEMNKRALSSTVKVVRDYLLPVAVGIEVDTSGWDNAYKRGSETFKQRRNTFIFINIPKPHKNRQHRSSGDNSICELT